MASPFLEPVVVLASFAEPVAKLTASRRPIADATVSSTGSVLLAVQSKKADVR
jgi:hypothetical protein